MGTCIHRVIRGLTRAYPFRTPANLFNVWMGKLFFEPSEPVWVRASAYDAHPAMELDLATPLQRKVFYFPRAYSRYWYGKPLAAYMRSLLQPGGAFVDIGANLGYYTHLAAHLVGTSGQVVAFEPDARMFAALERSVALNGLGQVTCVNQGLSSWTGTAQFFRTIDSTASSLVASTAQGRRFLEKAMIQVTSLDAWMRHSEHVPAHIDLIKIDVEGEEPRTVAGMLDTLPRMGFPRLWIEVRGPRGSKRAPNTFAPVYEQLGGLGYRAYFWDEKRACEIAIGDVIHRRDVLFARP